MRSTQNQAPFYKQFFVRWKMLIICDHNQSGKKELLFAFSDSFVKLNGYHQQQGEGNKAGCSVHPVDRTFHNDDKDDGY